MISLSNSFEWFQCIECISNGLRLLLLLHSLVCVRGLHTGKRKQQTSAGKVCAQARQVGSVLEPDTIRHRQLGAVWHKIGIIRLCKDTALLGAQYWQTKSTSTANQIDNNSLGYSYTT